MDKQPAEQSNWWNEQLREEGWFDVEVYGLEFEKEVKPVVELTAAAIEKLRVMEREPEEEGAALRIGVLPGGCSGFQYEMYWDHDVAPEEWVGSFEGGIRVVVDPFSAPKLVGTVLDWRESLMGAGFKIENPNVSRSCGCGKSFS